jgi:hypothetical protein
MICIEMSLILLILKGKYSWKKMSHLTLIYNFTDHVLMSSLSSNASP